MGGTCGEQVLDGIRVLQQPHGVHPQLQPVAVAISSFRVCVELLQAAHAIKVTRERLLLTSHPVHVEGVSLWHVQHPCGHIHQNQSAFSSQRSEPAPASVWGLLPSLSASFWASAPFPEARLPSIVIILLYCLNRGVVLSPRMYAHQPYSRLRPGLEWIPACKTHHHTPFPHILTHIQATG